ncbi:MAG: hypothetical protein WCK21_09560 [Actinomycetota bacterium]
MAVKALAATMPCRGLLDTAADIVDGSEARRMAWKSSTTNVARGRVSRIAAA